MNDEKLNYLRSNNVDVDTGISNMMDVATYNEMLDEFYGSLDEEMAKIEGFKNSGDMPNYAILVHALKSNARSFGFGALGEMAYDHELKSKASDVNFVNTHFDELKNMVGQTKKIIEQYKNM